MDILQIVAIGIIGATLALMLKPQAPDFALMISIVTSILIFLIILPKFSDVLVSLQKVGAQIDASMWHIKTILKIVGIAYVTEFGQQICIDAGESAVASKIELGGKILIMGLSVPILLSLVDMLVAVL